MTLSPDHSPSWLRWLVKPVDNSALVLFRVFCGLLLALEGAGAIATGWVKRNLIDPSFHFSFIGFEWLEPLPGNGMYFYYSLMALAGILIMLGWFYRPAAVVYALLWTGAYLMQKTSYNNHYYMTVLLTWVLVFLPANRAFSLDARFKPEIRATTHPNWIRWFFVIQIGIVYTFASIAKIYPDWLDLKPLMIWLPPRSHFYVIGPLFEHTWFIALIAYGGIIFDLLATPLLLWKRTRIPTFIVSVLFHLFNSATFHIGIFPYMMIALTLFFFPPEVIRKRFFPARKPEDLQAPAMAKKDRWMLATAGVYMVIQLILPLRHWVIPGNVTYTEEGHRMSWRMMLRSKTGTIYFKVVDNTTGVEENVYPTAFLTDKQARKMAYSPDMCWQFTQFLKKRYEGEGRSVAIYARGAVRLNKGPHYTLYDPRTDLAQVSWNYFWHNDWVLEPQDVAAP